MQKILERGFSETHLHLGAALNFSVAWAALMRALTSKQGQYSDFESPGACFDNGRTLGSWLLHAAVVRLVLADWLFNGRPDAASIGDLLSFASNRPGRRLNSTARRHLAALLEEVAQGKGFESPQWALATGSRYHLERRFAQVRALYQRLIGSDLIRSRTKRSLPPGFRAEYGVLADDPIADVIGWFPNLGSSPESSFVSKSLEQIEKGESDFGRLFWQLIRIRCLLYRHVVQRPLTPGLQWFVRFFSRIKPLRKNVSEAILASSAADLSGEGNGLASLEVRLGTEESVSACLQKVRALERSALPEEADPTFRFFRHRLEKEGSNFREKDQVARFEVGALFHFSRKRGGGWEFGKPNAYGLDHSYPAIVQTRRKLENAGNPTGFRFARFYREQRRHAQALVNLFRAYPQVVRTVRGIDLCTDEAGVPVWVMAPLVQWVRDAGEEAAKQVKRHDEAKILFRTSVHAGEDYVNLLTGLRRLDEAITHLALRRGDRVGHALALGEDPSGWSGRVGQIVQTSEERFFDLVWEHGRYSSRAQLRVSKARRLYVKSEIARLAAFIFGAAWASSYSPEDLLEFMKLLHDKRELHNHGFPDRPVLRARRPNLPKNEDNRKARARLLLAMYLGNETVWRRGRIPEIIDLLSATEEQAALGILQAAIRRKIKMRGLTIEVNPSSNILVGALGNFTGHPIWRLRPVTRKERQLNLPTLRVCVGSDDPLTFATRLRHEYQLLFDAMILTGHSKEAAVRWIEGVRKTGMKKKFTVSRDVDQIAQGLRVPSLLRSDQPEAPP
jgi:hypothetical protein